MEPLLAPDTRRFVLFPIRFPQIWAMYKHALSRFWTVEDLDLSGDLIHWDTRLTDEERHFITTVLAFFASADCISEENPVQRLSAEIQSAEARCFYGFQMAMENIHAETYSLLIDTYIRDADLKRRACLSACTVAYIARKADWVFHWLSADRPFCERIVAFAALKGIFFSASFASIWWLKRRGLMPGLTSANDLIRRDEAMHTRFAVLVYSLLQSHSPVCVITDIVCSAVDIECEFVKDALPDGLSGMNPALMVQYVQFVADSLLESFCLEKFYSVRNPFDFMDDTSFMGNTNVLDSEKRVLRYAVGSLGSQSSASFSTDADF
ncbi:ribonucleotide reductase small subunit [Favolaschia claudopus]|uniref:Ribonucleotide reductase small subunit n=1 Tax=Favolaschia claudopus TaxID=2862362 RepID=A0AAW0CFF1_9AGAR